MKKTHIILTVDYEVFGNGSGCVQKCVLEPTERMTRIAESFNAPVTFFVEPLEFLAMSATKQFGEISKNVSDQIRSVIKKGHDVQLHLHPQWTNPRLDENGNWMLDMARWRIGDIAANEVRRLLKTGKTWLESLCQPLSPDYQCIAFRAGGWCIQPSNHVISVLKDLGFRIDSTVAPGLYIVPKGEWSDFRNAPHLPFWGVSEDVCQDTDSGLIEVPIVTGEVGRINHLSVLWSSRKNNIVGLAPGCKGSYWGPDGRIGAFLVKTSKLAQLGHVMLDFSTMPTHILIGLTKQWIERNKNIRSPIPVVAIAHTKNFTSSSEAALERYLSWARDENINFSTFKQWLDVAYKGQNTPLNITISKLSSGSVNQ